MSQRGGSIKTGFIAFDGHAGGQETFWVSATLQVCFIMIASSNLADV
jgi:hypothetical protein